MPGFDDAGMVPKLAYVRGKRPKKSGPPAIQGEETPKAKPHYHGHRQRLRKRFVEGGPDPLPDYELLELILFQAIPRGDLKPLAKHLLKEFGSFHEVLSADYERLKKIDGIGPVAASAMKVVHAAAMRFVKQQVPRRITLSSWDAIINYVRADMAYAGIEQFRILFLDKKNQLIADELQQQGTVDHTPVYPREVIKRALELGASHIVLIHNHPSGDPTPSLADIDMTKKIIDAGHRLGIIVHDHIIVGRQGHVSFRAQSLL